RRGRPGTAAAGRPPASTALGVTVAAGEPVPARAGGAPATGQTGQAEADGGALARNSLAVVSWTMVSRISGFVRVAVVAAVLGPTYLGNIFQATNTLPNLAYAALTGSLFSNLLVPPLVRRVDACDRRATERLAGAFLSVALTVFAGVVAVVMLAAPLILRLLSAGVADPAA